MVLGPRVEPPPVPPPHSQHNTSTLPQIQYSLVGWALTGAQRRQVSSGQREKHREDTYHSRTWSAAVRGDPLKSAVRSRTDGLV
jgi:hypothetical protein